MDRGAAREAGALLAEEGKKKALFIPLVGDVKGQARSSVSCSAREKIRQAEDRGITTVTFLIGGSLGMSDELIRKADFKLSYSNMTFPHQLMRVMLLDQLQIICDM